ncbi:NUDIX hydrolase [Candidatus Microgenomates bacterium]|nr:NUDIX hydrolase [Candidatus Microgenomates bacterium]
MSEEFNENDRDPKPISLSVGLILETQSNGLVLVRQYGTKFWGPIAGRLKEKELFDDALLRELVEESGMRVNDIENIVRWDTPYVSELKKDKMGMVYKAMCRLSDNEINNLIPLASQEISEVRVFSKSEIYDFILGTSGNNRKLYKPEYNMRNLIRWMLSKQQEPENILLSTSSMK